MDKGYINGQTVATIREPGKIMLSADMESMYGKMVELMMVNGKMEKCMEKGFTFGRMVESLKDNILTIKSMG